MHLLTILANSDDGGSGGGSIIPLLILPLFAVAMYFLMIRPQKRRMREQSALQAALEVGDEVMLTSGVYGFITGFDEDHGLAWIEVDDDVQLRVLRSAISGKVDTTGASAAPTKEAGKNDGKDDGQDADDSPKDADASATSDAE